MVEHELGPAIEAVVLPQAVNADFRTKVGRWIFNAEVRRDSQGRPRIYNLPEADGGGMYEIAGINDRYHPVAASRLKQLIEQGHYQAVEREAAAYIADYTDRVDQWTLNPAINAFLRDCVFNRGATGTARILQHALKVNVDGKIGPNTLAALKYEVSSAPDILLGKLRLSREAYERHTVGRDPSNPLWKGLVNRWNNALAFAEDLLA